MNCKNCGSEVIGESRFCQKCGTPTEPPAMPNSPVVNQWNPTPVVPPGIINAKKPSGILSVLCWMFIFFASFAFMITFTVGNTISINAISGIIQDTIDMDELTEDYELFDNLEADISQEEVNDLFEVEEVKNYIANASAELALTGDIKNIDGEEFVDILKNNEDEIENIIDCKITNKDYKRISEEFEGSIEDTIDEYNESADAGFTDTMNSVLNFGSPIAIAICALFVLGLIAVMLLIRKIKSNGLIWSGTALLSSGLLYMVLTIAKNFMLDGVSSGETADLAYNIAFGIINALFNSILIASIITVVLGIGLIVTNIIIKSVNNKKLKGAM